MTTLQKAIPLFISIIVLVSALLFPSILFKLFDMKMMNKVYTEKFTRVSPIQTHTLDTKSRLELIYGYGNIENIVLTDKNEADNPKGGEDLSNTLNEINKMQEMGAFPRIDLNGENIILTNSISQTYTDLSSAGKYVKLNYLTFSTKNGIIKILKDKETNKIYQYELLMDESLGDSDIPNLAKNLSEYLDIQLANLSFSGEIPVKFATEDRKINYLILKTDNFLSVKILQFI